MDVRALEFQLEQVRSQLKASPENAGLKALESKLAALIEMNKESEREAEQAQAAAPPPVKLIELHVGDLCEAKKKNGESGAWWEATIQSVAADKLSCTVLFTGVADAQHCTPHMIRRHTSKTQKFPLSNPQKAAKPAPPPTAPKPSVVPATGPVRRKHTKAEHDQKKEAEHSAKQQSWQSFKQKIGGKGASGPFSKPPAK